MPGVLIATIPPRETLYAISRCLLWQGGAALWREWCLTLPDEVVAELTAHESMAAPGAKAQARAEPGGTPWAMWIDRRLA